eukprot:CAMPEP_0197013302 /NCGR_PEP_ID=MMETSP1380-20130617/65852_1 /TAXON_ID=5936 /ORGANISM="Euplotes crassus, Strain CT5" /LENGTH=109 /DNA_ID=CAMNT_0042437447 /DNA_START=21 /DNA_END=347 /DNA_ORIENTATION=+
MMMMPLIISLEMKVRQLKNRKPEPIPKEFQKLNTEAKVKPGKRLSSIKAAAKVIREKSESPIRKLTVNSNKQLLSEWEKKYGSKKDRQFHKDKEKSLNQWHGEPHQNAQ